MQASHLHRLVVFAIILCGSTLSATDYTSPYKVEFTFKQDDLIGDLVQGLQRRGHPQRHPHAPI